MASLTLLLSSLARFSRALNDVCPGKRRRRRRANQTSPLFPSFASTASDSCERRSSLLLYFHCKGEKILPSLPPPSPPRLYPDSRINPKSAPLLKTKRGGSRISIYFIFPRCLYSPCEGQKSSHNLNARARGSIFCENLRVFSVFRFNFQQVSYAETSHAVGKYV